MARASSLARDTNGVVDGGGRARGVAWASPIVAMRACRGGVLGVARASLSVATRACRGGVLGVAWASLIVATEACSGGVLGAGEPLAAGADAGPADREDSPADAADSITEQLDSAIPAAPDSGDAGEASAQVDAGPPGVITVVQSNIECGGKYADHACSGEVTYDTATRFADLMDADSVGDPAVIGMEEVSDSINDDGPWAGMTNHETLLQILEEETGRDYEVEFFEQGVDGAGSGHAIFWRPTLVAPAENFGTHDIERLANRYIVRFAGMLFTTVDGAHSFGIFVGKIVWGTAEIQDGDEVWPATPEDKEREARDVRAWIDLVMAPYPDATRIITTDLNAADRELEAPFYTSPAYLAMAEEYDAGETTFATTASGERLDYIWWDWDSGERRTDGFVEGPRRSMDFGSDHRFVWADVLVR
ncbi:MAG: endonuclease/exonuclease/phosphatase family protein [Deltaproteobacteria bacterium]|nr:endonuclease/exonuclease/phosphatase family protein [Deltaproteobacteria bacterium]